MKIINRAIELEGSSDMDVTDITPVVEHFLLESGIRSGSMLVFAPGSTAAVTTIEFESGAVADLKRTMEQIAPRDDTYEHNLRWGDGNGYSHVRAALMGPSLMIPVVEGELVLGTWQQIIVCDFDNRRRQRRIELQALGNE